MLKSAGIAIIKAAKILGLVIAAIIAIAAVGAIRHYFEQRDQKQAETAEFFRRNAMTPEQRIAEDRARKQAAAEQAKTAAAEAKAADRAALEKRAYVACMNAIAPQLRDPGSADFKVALSYPEEGGLQHVVLSGRAKNGFGGFAFVEWHCTGTWNGSEFRVSKLQAIPE